MPSASTRTIWPNPPIQKWGGNRMLHYVPERNDIISFDSESDSIRTALVLSSKPYNVQTGLVICSPLSTRIRGTLTEVPVDSLSNPSIVTANIIQTLAWTDRNIHFVAEAENSVMEQVLLRLIPLIGADRVIERFIE